jgi:pimeloyl-ACP methyl ester carboxylesterase
VDPKRPTVVYLPGLFAGGWIWEPAWKCLAAETGFDQLRLADSLVAYEARVDSAADWRNWLLKLLDSQEIERPILCGNSLGGLIVLDFAAHYPDRVYAAVASGAPGMKMVPVFSLQEFMEWLNPKGGCEKLARHLFYDRSRVPMQTVERLYGEVNTLKRLRLCVEALHVAKQYDATVMLPKIRCPLMLIWGEHDQVTPLEEWKQHLDKIERCTLRIIRDCGHSPMVELPSEFNKEFLAFLQPLIPGG